MGWRGVLRSMAAASRAAERDAQRRHKQQQKERMVAEAGSAVVNWENYVNDLVSIHTEGVEKIDWHTIANQLHPIEPQMSRAYQDSAETALANFKPSIFHMFKGGSSRVRKKLEEDLQKAPIRDEKHFQDALSTYKQQVFDWENETTLAKQLVCGEAQAIQQVIEEMQSLSKTELIGSEIQFSIDNNFVHAQPKVHDDQIIPSVRRKQLASGRLSETKMPVGQFNELYQDYVASVALKTGGDLFYMLPLEEVYVTCVSKVLNLETGHKEWMPILSVRFVRDTFMHLNLSKIDPSESMHNFKHEMKFSKTKGFSPIEPLKPVVL